MADQKISELTALTGANVADDDAIAIVDTSATETKKIVFSELKNALDTATGFVRITGDTMTGALTTTGLTVDGDANLSGAAVNFDLDETDTTDLNTRFRQSAGQLFIQTLNDAKSLGSNRVNINHTTGDISFYEDTGTTAKFFWDASAESLGIGTDSPSHPMTIQADGTNGNSIKIIGDSTNSSGRIMWRNSADTAEKGRIAVDTSSNMTFHAGGGTERMRIGSSGVEITGTATISTTDYYASSTFSGTLKGAANNTKAALLLNSVSSSGQNAFASIHSEPIADFRASLIGTYSADGSGAGYFSIKQFVPSSSATLERMRIDSSGNVGIGTSSPNAPLQVKANGTAIALQPTSDTDNSIILFRNAADTANAGAMYYDHTNDAMVFWTNGSTEAMRIDSSGNLLVGQSITTVPGAGNTTAGTSIRGEDGVFISRTTSDTSASALQVNKTTGLGAIINIASGGSTAGSIGVQTTTLGVNPYIAGSGGRGLSFDVDTNTIFPCSSTGARADGTANLGVSSARFNDLHLSGGVVFGDAGGSGTSTSNTLDSYEEGTWTPYYNSSGATFTYNTQYGSYVRVGNIVHAQFYLNATATGTTSNSAEVQGLPFTTANLSPYHQWGCSCWFSGSLVLQPLTGNNSTAFSLWKNGAVSTALASEVAGGRYLVGHVTYRTT